MRILFGFLCLILLSLGLQASGAERAAPQYAILSLDYIGRSDKPITPVVIGNAKDSLEWFDRKYIYLGGEFRLVNDSVANREVLSRMISESLSMSGGAPREAGPHSVLRVTVVRDGEVRRLFLGPLQGMRLINKLVHMCGDNRKTCEDVAEFSGNVRHYLRVLGSP